MKKKIAIKTPEKSAGTPDDWVTNRDGIKRLTVDIPLSVHSKLKILSARDGKTMGAIVRELLDKYLQGCN